MIPWGGVGCCLSAAVLYLLGRSTEKDADVLKSVTRVNKLRDISALLDTACKVLPLVVTISGRVGSETPIKCDLSGLKGVIVEETEKHHYLKRNDAGSWKEESSSMVSTRKEVPWYLDDRTGHVFVVGARGAIDFALKVVSNTFEDSGRSVFHETPDDLQDLKMLGVRRIEMALPVGTPLTVVGEAVKDDLGTVRIQQPHKGPFYVSPKSVDQLIVDLVKFARWYKVVSMGFTVFGVYLFAKHVLQNTLERRRRRFLQKRVLDAAAKRKEQESEGPNNNSEKGPNICVICLENNKNAVFDQCGHMCCCMPCASHLTRCPLCRRRINQVVRVFRLTNDSDDSALSKAASLCQPNNHK